MDDSCKEIIQKSQYLRNCGHFLGVDYFAFPHCRITLEYGVTKLFLARFEP